MTSLSAIPASEFKIGYFAENYDVYANRGTPAQIGQLYYATDGDSNGGFWISEDTVDENSWIRPASSIALDASDITYTPTTVADWDSSADPGDVDGALDQLAERVKDNETAISGLGGTGSQIVCISRTLPTEGPYPTGDTNLDWYADVYDPDGWHNTSTNRHYFTVPSGDDGDYVFALDITLAVNTSLDSGCHVKCIVNSTEINGGDMRKYVWLYTTASNHPSTWHFEFPVTGLVAGDNVYFVLNSTPNNVIINWGNGDVMKVIKI